MSHPNPLHLARRHAIEQAAEARRAAQLARALAGSLPLGLLVAELRERGVLARIRHLDRERGLSSRVLDVGGVGTLGVAMAVGQHPDGRRATLSCTGSRDPHPILPPWASSVTLAPPPGMWHGSLVVAADPPSLELTPVGGRWPLVDRDDGAAPIGLHDGLAVLRTLAAHGLGLSCV